MRRPLATLSAFFILTAPASAAWQWPVSGEVITSYRNGSDPYATGQHRGIDIAAPAGSTVVAAAAGEVRFAGTAGSSGVTVSIRTGDGYDTSYLHLSSLAVRAGARVAAGDRIGAVGTTGTRSASQPHLHFGVRDAGTRHAYHDPLNFLPPPPAPPRAPDPAPTATPEPAPAPPAAAPVPRRAPAPARGRAPAPVPRRGPGRVPRRGPAPAPARGGAPEPILRPTPAPARGGAPASARGGAPAPAEGRAPAHAPAGGRAPAHAPAGGRAPAHAPAERARVPAFARGRAPVHAPARGRAPAPVSGGDPVHAGAPRSAPNDAPRLWAAPDGRREATEAAGPDIGWVLACAGLLLAAGILGLTSGGARSTARRRAGLLGALRPLLGRR